MQKNRRIPAPEEVLRIFDDNCIEVLAKQANLSWAANVPRFAAGVRCAARQYVADQAIPSDRAVRDEIKALYSAANRYRYKETATRLGKISERTRALLKTRGDRLDLAIPEPEALRNGASQHSACETIVRLLRTGWEYGKPLLYSPGPAKSLDPPEKPRRPPRRKAELDFVMWLEVAYFEATGIPPTHMANPDRPGPFARMVQACLKNIAPGANAVELLNELHQRRLTKAPELRTRKSGTRPKTRT
jgi:hypothetical protein